MKSVHPNYDAGRGARTREKVSKAVQKYSTAPSDKNKRSMAGQAPGRSSLKIELKEDEDSKASDQNEKCVKFAPKPSVLSGKGSSQCLSEKMQELNDENRAKDQAALECAQCREERMSKAIGRKSTDDFLYEPDDSKQMDDNESE